MTEWIAKRGHDQASELEVRGKKIPSPIVQILQNRGYDTHEKIEKFFAPSITDLHDPFLLNDMEKAADRLVTAVKMKERIMVHGDYDTDGISGTALLVSNLRKLGLEVTYFIPRRLVEGYGLSRAGIEHAISNRCSLVITVDCGITAFDEISFATKNAIDVIVSDHHEPKAELPGAHALIDPKLAQSKYPFRELAGVGVAYKLLEALYAKLGQARETLYEDLDYVALGTVVDIVPLIDENRIFVKYGLKKITKGKKVGFRAILEDADLTGELTAYHLGFVIGPRINACGRLRDAQEALELFLTEDQAHARDLAKNLSQDNQARQAIEENIYHDARQQIEGQDLAKDRVLVVGQEGWHEGVVGVVASRLSADYYRPVIVVDIKDNMAKGSARSVLGFDITEALNSCGDLLLKYGGHSQAAGLELRQENLIRFRTQINVYAQKFAGEVFTKHSIYDLDLNLNELTEEVVFFLKFFEPTGMANPQPVFLGENFEVVGIPRVVGSDHLRFALRSQGKAFDAIAFGQAESILGIEVGKTRINCLYSVAEDSFFGKRKIILKIKEMKGAALH